MIYQETLSVHGTLDLASTFLSGQSFRWKPWGKSWAAAIEDSLWIVGFDEQEKILKVQSSQPEFRGLPLREGVIQYFRLRDSIHSIQQSILNRLQQKGHANLIPRFREIFDFSPGLRVLRQNPFESLVSFMLSVQSTIPLVQRRIEHIASVFSENRRSLMDFQSYLFPSIQQMSRLDEKMIQKSALGFRSRWLLEMIQSISDKDLESLHSLSFPRKMDRLLSIKGVGCKVASCTLLYGYGDLRAFPVDVWVARSLHELFGWDDVPHLLMEKGMQLFGDTAGYAQLYLFRYFRQRGGKGGA